MNDEEILKKGLYIPSGHRLVSTKGYDVSYGEILEFMKEARQDERVAARTKFDTELREQAKKIFAELDTLTWYGNKCECEECKEYNKVKKKYGVK